MSDQDLVLLVATYENLDDATNDFAALKSIKHDSGLRDLTAAMVAKDDKGRLKVHESTHAGKVGAAIGLVGGAVLGALFPPAGVAILASLAVDGVVAGTVLGSIGHFAGGVSRKDLKELGSMLEDGEAAIVTVAADDVSTDIDKALGKASKKANRALDKGDVDAAITDIQNGIDKAAAV